MAILSYNIIIANGIVVKILNQLKKTWIYKSFSFIMLLNLIPYLVKI